MFHFSVNLTSVDENRSFRSFMIQARRTDTNLDINEPIGSFTPLDEIDAIQDCGSPYGVSFTRFFLKESDTGFSISDTKL